MTARREKSKPQKPQLNKQLEVAETAEQKPIVNQRKEKFADFLIDVAKYVFTGVIITSLFNDMEDKSILYVLGMFIVVVTLTIGLILIQQKKGQVIWEFI